MIRIKGKAGGAGNAHWDRDFVNQRFEALSGCGVPYATAKGVQVRLGASGVPRRQGRGALGTGESVEATHIKPSQDPLTIRVPSLLKSTAEMGSEWAGIVW